MNPQPIRNCFRQYPQPDDRQPLPEYPQLIRNRFEKYPQPTGCL
jgi:hypothetical protein